MGKIFLKKCAIFIYRLNRYIEGLKKFLITLTRNIQMNENKKNKKNKEKFFNFIKLWYYLYVLNNKRKRVLNDTTKTKT